MTILQQIGEEILPRHYKKNRSELVGEGWMLHTKGAYVFLAIPFDQVPDQDYNSDFARSKLKSIMTCLPVIREKGLFLLYYGEKSTWEDQAHSYKVDKTGLHAVILQCVCFIDPVTGENSNSRTHWGPIRFGFCGNLLDDIEQINKR